MKITKKSDIKLTGRMILIYSETKVGKTTSILQSAPDPILYIRTEQRSLKAALDAANRPDLRLSVAEYENFDGLMEFVADAKNFEKYSTIALDSLSYLSNISLSCELEDEAFSARTEEEQKRKPLVGRTKMSMEAYGGLSSNLFRLLNALGRLSAEHGKIVIFTCLQTEAPKWGRELAAAPTLKGKEFPSNIDGFFDLIGKLESRYDKKGERVYPPIVRFDSPEKDFLAGFTGTGKTAGPLDFKKFLGGK